MTSNNGDERIGHSSGEAPRVEMDLTTFMLQGADGCSVQLASDPAASHVRALHRYTRKLVAQSGFLRSGMEVAEHDSRSSF